MGTWDGTGWDGMGRGEGEEFNGSEMGTMMMIAFS